MEPAYGIERNGIIRALLSFAYAISNHRVRIVCRQRR